MVSWDLAAAYIQPKMALASRAECIQAYPFNSIVIPEAASAAIRDPLRQLARWLPALASLGRDDNQI